MPLNPVQFGKDVIDQFGRYLLTTFPVADPRLRQQFKEGLSFGLGGKERLAKGPYVYLSRPFVEGPTLRELIADPSLDLHPALAGIFNFERLYKHQEEALRAAKTGNHVIIATGTGSGKTEGFLLPIIDECLKARDRGESRGPIAILIYPMNALVNDQLERLRKLLAGTRITFGRYTGETPETEENIPRLPEPRPYTRAELLKAQKPGQMLPLPWEECFSRKEILERRPQILLTNYSMLEYLLLRHKDIELFLEAPLKFIVLDEIHTHTGSRGSEIACLIRRVRGITGKTRDEVICIGTSATLKSADTGESGERNGEWEAELKRFAANIFGVPEDKLYLVQESYQERKEKGSFRPPPPEDPQRLFHEILKSVREVQLQDEVTEVSPQTIKLAEKLVSLKAPEGEDTLAVLYKLLSQSEIISFLEAITETPRQLKEIVNEFKKAFPERKRLPDAALEAEILSYLTLGALARLDDEPLLRPKLHYFVQGLQGVYIAWQEDGVPNIFFDQAIKTDRVLFELKICRSCGQHYVRETYSSPFAVDHEGEIYGVRILSENSEDAESLYFTDAIVPGVEEEVPGESGYLCPYCGAIHDRDLSICLNEKCRRETKLIPIIFFPTPLHHCVSCGAANPDRSPVITPVKSAEVSDVMILAQTMLSAMPEPSLRKLIVFADSRQEAAFQAGWMENRSRRHRLRHLVYQILKSEPERIFSIDSLHEKLIEKAAQEGLLPRVRWGQEEEHKRLRWFIVEELASLTRRQMRGSLEQLGLSAVLYDGIEPENLTDLIHWLEKFEISTEDLGNLIHALLDIYRIQGVLSDPFLQRGWSSQDAEVRKGIVNITEYYCPHVLVFQKEGESKYQKGWLAQNGRSAAQVFLKKVFPTLKSDARDRFLEELWEWLIEKDLLVPAEIKRKRAGRIVSVRGGSGYQINYKRIGIKHSEGRYVCQSCRLARSRPTPGGVCPAYRCKGRLIYQHWDEEHYDVVQYTKLDFVPLIPREHSAQVPQDDRLKYEREFKEKESTVNCLVATPTLELGVDIGQLEMVLMRNVPPSPASYVQRSGRAGRRHRIGVVFTYCRNRSHDKYFYRHPEQMISGRILVPAFSMQNEPLIRKHIFSTVLSFLRQKEDTAEIINAIIPSFIWHYFGQKENGRERYRDKPVKVKTPLKEAIRKYRDEILNFLETIFTDTWPEESRSLVSRKSLEKVLKDMPDELQTIVDDLFARVSAYKRILNEYAELERKGERLSPEDKNKRNRYEKALDRLWIEEQENYAITYLAKRGFLPGYALTKDTVRAQCAEPYIDLPRPTCVALREFVPANLIYANRNEFRVERLNFYVLQARDKNFRSQMETFYVDGSFTKLAQGRREFEGGGEETITLGSVKLVDVELEPRGNIGDQQEYPRRVSYQILGLLSPYHAGGFKGRLGKIDCTYYYQGQLKLVNVGPYQLFAKGGYGFPICPVCGELRSPFASQAEIESFAEGHRKKCGRGIERLCLHTEVHSDLLIIGPFESETDPYHVAEIIRIGTRLVLDMGDQELENISIKDDAGGTKLVFYDPIPGGTGFLPLILRFWSDIVLSAKVAIEQCDCEEACYNCLLHYRNQPYHNLMSRSRALALIEDLLPWQKEHDIPPNYVEVDIEDEEQLESPAEERFLKILKKRGFPTPVPQFEVVLGGTQKTIADFAYPDHKILIYIDGLSEGIHGNPVQRQKDKLLRAKAQAKGFKILEIPAEALSDRSMLADYLDVLSDYLSFS